MSLSAYVDIDWGKCISSRWSITGYYVYFGDSMVSWKSKKQDNIFRISIESEYRAPASITYEIMWILKLFFDLKLGI